MKLKRRIRTVLVLGACAASIAQADARQRSQKHVTTPPRHVSQPHHAPGAANVRANASSGAPVSRNAIGLATPPAIVGSSATAKAPSAGANAVVVNPNAVGVHAPTGVSTSSVPAGAAKIGPAASPTNGVRAAAPFVPPQAHVGTISGTGMTRPGSAPATIGGPAKMAGGLGGAAVRQKK